MKHFFNDLLNKQVFFKYGFYLLLFMSIVLNILILPIMSFDSELYIFFILSVIFLGIGYYEKPIWVLLLGTAIVVTARFFLIAEPFSGPITYIIHLITYFLITFISTGLMRNYQRIKSGNIELVTALANALDSRDSLTANHSQNVARLSLEIAKEMNLPRHLYDVILEGGLLHVIGKIGVPEHILIKQGKLTDEEYTLIKEHPVIGYNIIKHISNFDKNGILNIVLYHHERYDGKGYPKGLKGEDIPLVARIVALADTFDAMTSKRVYRDKLDLDYAVFEIRKHRGTQFDPNVVDAFLKLYKRKMNGLDLK
ncbi:HD-GYP domain-containing protein [Metabacillus niabensis]|uniref:HD-GYP domain-containing protein (C-di-GMP phosphodiesterase class II) n=1 Tax=Metabacillus niabensis TaxID=324854 RepID=A0ABT9Z3S8_9BACI|nr:HD-GYP domain-containing protein [Metabacillus niabensis]MDQ0225920.1 HD-GYP domain-containing protein (c-di-GMP phosphodiesterase class II) [Metabacillus niabensis]